MRFGNLRKILWLEDVVEKALNKLSRFCWIVRFGFTSETRLSWTILMRSASKESR